MKSSLSSPEACSFARRIHVALFLALLASTATPCLSKETTPFPRRTAILAHHHHHHHHHQDHDHGRRNPCESFSHEKPRSLCEQFHRSIHHRPPPLPPPPPPEIDPIYGVDKRLVPSGPNPLHN